MQEEGTGETNRPIRVLLADDHTMFRQGDRGPTCSYGGLEIIAQVPNDQEALRLAQEEKPDVVVIAGPDALERAKESLLKVSRIRLRPRWL
jgi:DNA-binding NarL/FixJ family response regulator